MSDLTHINNKKRSPKIKNGRTQLLTEIGQQLAELSIQVIQSAKQAAKSAVSIPAIEAQPVIQLHIDPTTVTKPPFQSTSQAKTSQAWRS